MLLSESELVKIIREELREALDLGQPGQDPNTISDEEAGPLVVKTVRAYIGRWRECYEEKLRTDPEFQGKWDLFIDISTTGQIENPKVSPASGTEPDKAFEDCLTEKTMGMKVNTGGKALANPMTGLGPIPLVFVPKTSDLKEQEDSQVDSEAVDVIKDFEELDPEAKAQTRAALAYGAAE